MLTSQKLGESLAVQGRVIKALYLRELKTRFGEKRLGFLWLFGEPLMHILAFVIIWKVLGRLGPPGIEPMLFLITGIVPFIMFSNIVNRVLKAVEGNRALLAFPQVKIIDLVVSRIILEVTAYSVILLFFISVFEYLGISSPIEYPLGVYSKFLLMALLGGGIGYVLIPIIAIIPFVESMVKFFIRATYITSGVFFSIDRLPENIRQYIDWNPVLQLLHMLRADYFPEIALKDDFSNLGYIIVLIVMLWLMGIRLTNKLMLHILKD